MATLTKPIELLAGQPLYAQTVNDILETAVSAFNEAKAANAKAEETSANVANLIDEAIGQALNSEV